MNTIWPSLFYKEYHRTEEYMVATRTILDFTEQLNRLKFFIMQKKRVSGNAIQPMKPEVSWTK